MGIIILAGILWIVGDFIIALSNREEKEKKIIEAEWEIIKDKDSNTYHIRDRE